MEKGDLSAGECDLFVGFVGVGLSISESPNLLGVLHTNISRVY